MADKLLQKNDQNQEQHPKQNESIEAEEDIVEMSNIEEVQVVNHVEQSDVEKIDVQNNDAPFISEYVKSASPSVESHLTEKTSPEVMEETDLFEDATNTPSLSSCDNRVQMKKAICPEKLQSLIPQPTDLNKFKIDVNRINELDKFCNIPSGRTFINHLLRPDFLLKVHKDSLPGPSNVMPKKKKRIKKSLNTESDDNSNSYDDVKSITNCLIKNTLNKLEINDVVNNFKDDVIEFNLQVVEQMPKEKEEDNIEASVVVPLEVQEQEPIENRDLVIYRDNEGCKENPCACEDPNCMKITSIEDIVPKDLDENIQEINRLPVIFKEKASIDNVQSPQEDEEEEEEVLEVAQASKEALVDSESDQSMLDDFEIIHPMEASLIDIESGQDIVLVGIRSNVENSDAQGSDVNGFPNWLLQILGAHVVAVEDNVPTVSNEEPDYFCQGDGLGVHPSVIVEVEDEEDTTDSSNNTAEFADVEQGPSNQDVSSISVDPLAATSEEATNRDVSNVERSQQLDASSSSESGIDSN